MSVLRPGQLDLGVAVAENLVSKELPGTVTNFIKAASIQPIVRKFNFMTQEGRTTTVTPDLMQAADSLSRLA